MVNALESGGSSAAAPEKKKKPSPADALPEYVSAAPTPVVSAPAPSAGSRSMLGSAALAPEREVVDTLVREILPEWDAALVLPTVTPTTTATPLQALRADEAEGAPKYEPPKPKPVQTPKNNDALTRLTMIPPTAFELEKILNEEKTQPAFYGEAGEVPAFMEKTYTSADEYREAIIKELDPDGTGSYAVSYDPESPDYRGTLQPAVEVVDKQATREKRDEAWQRARKATPVTRELTPERYASLSPIQRNAVDFNTLTVNARELDLNFEGKVSEEEKGEYDAAVEKMFGPSTIVSTGINFAPETLSILQAMDYEPPETGVGSEFDDFLRLDAALTGKELKYLGLDASKPGETLSPTDVTAPPLDVQDFNTVTISNTMEVEQSIKEAGDYLQDFQASVVAGADNFRLLFGTELQGQDRELGYGTTADDVYFRKAFSALANAENDEATLGLVWDDINTFLPEGNPLRQEFFNYIDRVSSSKLDYQGKLPGDPELYRTSIDFREIAGLEIDLKKEG